MNPAALDGAVLSMVVEPVGQTARGGEIVEPCLPGLTFQFLAGQRGVETLLELHEIIGGTDFARAPEFFEQRGAILERRRTAAAKRFDRTMQGGVAGLRFLQSGAQDKPARMQAGGCGIGFRPARPVLSTGKGMDTLTPIT